LHKVFALIGAIGVDIRHLKKLRIEIGIAEKRSAYEALKRYYIDFYDRFKSLKQGICTGSRCSAFEKQNE